MSARRWAPPIFLAAKVLPNVARPDRERAAGLSKEATSAGRRTVDVPGGSDAAMRCVLLAVKSHTKGGIKRMAKKTAKGGKKKGGKKR